MVSRALLAIHRTSCTCDSLNKWHNAYAGDAVLFKARHQHAAGERHHFPKPLVCSVTFHQGETQSRQEGS